MADPRRLLQQHILGVAHVGFVVPCLDAAVANAVRVYGLDAQDVRYQPPPGEASPTRFAFFRVGDLDFELIEPRSQYFRDILLAAPSGGAGINHVAWKVDDIEAAVALLDAVGIRPGYVTPEGVVAIGDKKMVYLDPGTTGGLMLELIEYPVRNGSNHD